jgi:hypothetical protein
MTNIAIRDTGSPSTKASLSPSTSSSSAVTPATSPRSTNNPPSSPPASPQCLLSASALWVQSWAWRRFGSLGRLASSSETRRTAVMLGLSWRSVLPLSRTAVSGLSRRSTSRGSKSEGWICLRSLVFGAFERVCGVCG